MGGVAGKGAGEQSLARKLYRTLDDDWLLIADRNFFNWAADWCTAADSGAQLLWRVKADLSLPEDPRPAAGRIWTRTRPAMCGWSSMRSPTVTATARTR